MVISRISCVMCLLIFIFISACSSNIGEVPAGSLPKSPALVKIQTNFLDDIAEAEIADRMALNCKEFEFNIVESKRVIEKLSLETRLLQVGGRISNTEVRHFGVNVSKLMNSKSSRLFIVAKVKENLTRIGITRKNYKHFCTVAEDQYRRRTQIGRFLKKTRKNT